MGKKPHIIKIEDFVDANMGFDMASAWPKRLRFDLLIDKHGACRPVFTLTTVGKRYEAQSLTEAIRRYNEEDFDAP